jgi:shikimate dehydrogenase
MKLYGLIGFPLTHSFSKKYFTEKFEKENISNHQYELFEIKEASSLSDILKQNPSICGLNVTIPHKQAVMPMLKSMDESASFVGAVNVIKVEKDGSLRGYNSDYYGFMESLKKFMPSDKLTNAKALILGTGGAAKAVEATMRKLQIPFKYVSRQGNGDILGYEQITKNLIAQYTLIINATPLGTFPKTDACPDIPYEALTSDHYLFDLVYNPEKTLFMQNGEMFGAKTKNGLEMLHLQAEKAWEIWNS